MATTSLYNSTYKPLNDRVTPKHANNNNEEENEESFWKRLKSSESRGSFSMLTRATSFMTWDTSDTSTNKYNDEEAQKFTLLSKKQSLHSLTGFTILPTIYGSTNDGPEDDALSDDCSYATGRDKESFEDDSDISVESTFQNESDALSLNDADSLKIRNIFQQPKQSFDGQDVVLTINKDEIDAATLTKIEELLMHITASTKMVQTKSKGVKVHQPVPQFTFSECVWTFSGSFVIIFLLSFLSSNITLWNEHGHAFPLGPFGALTTLQYSLGDAAPAQPRNAILGSTLCGCVAMCSTYISEDYIPPALRIALATSLSIALMARLGIMHPPGGAIALVFAVGHYHWGHLLLTLIGCCIAVLLATIINNLNKNRQYPQYWDFAAPVKQIL